MKKKIVLFSSLIIALVLLIGVNSCKKDETVTFALSSLKSGIIDMNSATPPSNVPTNPTIEAVFSLDVDATTANATKITLEQDYDATAINLTITVSGAKITIVPDQSLGNGALYKLSFKAGIKATDGQSLPAFDRTFTTEGTFVPAGVYAYWNFNDTPNEQVAGTAPIGNVNLTYADSYTATAGKCARFDGTTTIVEFANGDLLMNTADFTLSFWVKAVSAGHVDAGGNPKGHFVMGLGAFHGFQFEITADYSWCKLAAQYELADGTTAAEDLWFPGDGQTWENGGWQGWTFCKDLTASGGVAALIKDTWAHVVCTYESATRLATMYINGEKMKQFDFNLWPDGDVKRGVVGLLYGGVAPEVVNELAFGFIQSRAGTLWDTEPWGGYDFPTSNHFGGYLDDVRIFHKTLTPTEISLMYNSEKP
ncbi:MAG: Ig-like domain-containing protein [Bacteroidetes bacterium]|nr:Ig-like domain-containing protein [Bacteroidota bacterium]